MPVKTATDAYGEMKAHIDRSGTPYERWYVGIAGDPSDSLFNRHRVPRENGWWIFRECATSDEARRVEQALIALGTDGGPGGGDATTRFVYAYLKTPNTQP